MIALGNNGSSNIQISPTSKISSKDWFQADIEIKVNCFSGKINAFFESDNLGHIRVEGHAYEQACYGNCLNFQFELDQTYLLELIDSLKNHVRN